MKVKAFLSSFQPLTEEVKRASDQKDNLKLVSAHYEEKLEEHQMNPCQGCHLSIVPSSGELFDGDK